MLRTTSILITTLGLVSAAGAAVDFQTTSSLPVSQRPGGVASGDFNGDGLADLAITADTIDRIDIFFGTGAGAFSAPTPVFTGPGTGPDSIRAADLDNDGDTDLVVALKNINTVRVYTNTAGLFSPGADTGTGARPVFLELGDADGNGTTDVISANRDGNSVTVMLNAGGTLSSASFATGTEPRAVALGDFNNDGSGDLAVVNHDDRTISILSNSGAGAFALSATIPAATAGRPEGVVAADFDQDGLDDIAIAVSNNGLHVAAVYLNNGAGLGGASLVNVNGFDPGHIAAGDLNGDGLLDLVTSNQDSANISVMEATAPGVFAPGIPLAAGANPEFIEIADMDNNGSPDIAVTNRDSNSATLWFNADAGACSPADLAQPLGTLNVLDVVAFIDVWNAGAAGSDFDANGATNVLDVVAFITVWSQGCP